MGASTSTMGGTALNATSRLKRQEGPDKSINRNICTEVDSHVSAFGMWYNMLNCLLAFCSET